MDLKNNGLEYAFKKNLSDVELIEIENFYNSLQLSAIEQYPEWNKIAPKSEECIYFSARKNNAIVCAAVLVENKYLYIKTMHIYFGPLFKEADDLIDSVKEIRAYCKKNKYSYLAIQLALPTGALSDYVECKLNQAFDISCYYDSSNWSSLIIDLSPPIDDIFRNFSKGHKSAIKKSFKDGVVVKKADSENEVKEICEVYLKMNEHRGIGATTESHTKLLFENMYRFFQKENKGFMLSVSDNKNNLVGGLVIVFQGNTARYYKGASDPDRRDVAALHIGIFESIKIAKDAGCKFFDLWGYNHYAVEGEQIYNINRFKKGFSENFIFFPKIMHIVLNPLYYFIYKKMLNSRSLKYLYKLIK